MQSFPTDTLKPFFPEVDESKLANVSLRLDEGKSTSTFQDTRTFASLTKCSKATEQLGHLPVSGETRHCILKGDFALFDFIPATLALAGKPIDEMIVATLSLSAKNAEDLGNLVQSGRIKKFSILVSHYFSAQEREIFGQISEICQKSGCKAIAMRTHAKVLLMSIGDYRYVVESGTVVKSPNGYPVQNPYLTVSTLAVKQMTALFPQLGLSPASRTKLTKADDKNSFLHSWASSRVS